MAAATEPHLRFVRELPGDSTRRDIAAHVLPLADGALITGWTSKADEAPNGLVLRVDGDGNVMWRLEPGGDGADLLFAAQPDSEGFLCAGFTSSSGAGSTDGWFVRIARSGSLSGERTVGGEGQERLTSLVATADGWMAAGQQERAGDTEAWVVRLDRAGEPRAQWTWGGAGVQRGLGIAALADGGCVVTGRTGEGRDEVDGWVTRLSPEGKPLWTHAITGAGFQVAYHVRKRRDGSIMATGYGFANVARDHDAFVIRLGADGQLLSRRDLGSTGYDRATQTQELDDGSSITVGYTKRAGAADDQPAWRTTLYGLDPAGRPTWSRAIGGEGYESGRWIAGTARDVWVVSQSTPALGGSRVLVARLDASRR